MKVTWGAAADASGYEIYYSTTNTPPTAGTAGITANVAISGTTATITGLANGATYYVWVRAKNSLGASAYTPAGSGTPGSASEAPGVPVISSVTAGDKTMTVTWGPVAFTESYEVYYSTINTQPAAATPGTITATGLTAAVTGLTNATTYYVWVRGINGHGAGAYSEGKSGTPGAVDQSPGAPAITSVVGGEKTLTVTWGPVGGATGYDLYYDTASTAPTAGAAGITANVAISGTTATITALADLTTYYVWVRAKSATGVSAYSGGVPGTTVTLTGIPGDGRYKGAATYPGYEDGYNINSTTGILTYYEGDTTMGDMGFAGQMMNFANNVIIIKVTAAGSWGPEVGKYYAVYCADITPFSFTGSNAYGAQATMDTLQEAIDEFTDAKDYFGIKAGFGLYGGGPSITGFNTGLEVTWGTVTGATGYAIYYDASSTPPTSATPSTTTGVTISGTTATITGLTNTTTYYVWVRAKAPAGAWVYQGSGAPEAVTIDANAIGYFQSEVAYYPGYGFVDDAFKTDNTAKTFYYYGNSTQETRWGGTIVKIIPQTDPEPAIMIIKVTEVVGSWSPAPVVGKYFAAAYKDPTSFAVYSNTAYSSGPGAKNTGVDTIAEAINEYTRANGYYDYISSTLYYPHAATISTLADLQGTWYDDDSDLYVVIKGTTFLWFMDDYSDVDGVYDSQNLNEMLMMAGDIADYTTSGTSGVMYLKVVEVDHSYAAYSIGKYVAFAWKDRSGDDIDFSSGNSSNEKDTLADSKNNYYNPADTGGLGQFPAASYEDYEKQ
jgi:hypothetical protein